MISGEDIVREIDEISILLSARAGMSVSDEATANVAQGMARNLEGKIVALRCVSASAGLQLLTAITNSSFAPELKQQLHHVVDTRLASSSSAFPLGPSVSKLQPQKLITPYSYLTQCDWGVIQNATSSHADRVQKMIDRFQAVGIASLHETTVKSIVNLLVCEIYAATSNYPSSDVILEMVKEFKRLYKQRVRPVPFARFTAYPASPFDLPQAVFDHAYPVKEDPPISMTIPLWESTMDQIIVRSSSGKLAHNRARQAQQATAVDGTAVIGMLSQLVHTLQGNQSSGNMLPGFRMAPQLHRAGSVGSLSDGSAGSDGQQFALSNQHPPSAADLRLQLTQRAIADANAQPNVSPARALQFAPPLRGRSEAIAANAPAATAVFDPPALDLATAPGVDAQDSSDEVEPVKGRIPQESYEDAAVAALKQRVDDRKSIKRPAAAEAG